MSVQAAPIATTSTARRALGRLAWTLVPAAPFVIVTLIWIMATGILSPSKETLPPVTDVLASIKELALSGQLATNVVASLYRLLLGSILGIVTGLIGGVIVGLTVSWPSHLIPLWSFSTRFPASSGCR